MNDKEIKEKFKPIFERKFKKFFPIKTLKEYGFERRKCKVCNSYFWSIKEKDTCNDIDCTGSYDIYGKRWFKKKYSYFELYEVYKKFMKKYGYEDIGTYPVVARWYDELFFVVAGINIFQPYATAGIAAPVANPAIERQFCLRFNDIENVGITGRHYTSFVMVGQHVFNYGKKKIYWKNEVLNQLLKFYKHLGLKLEDVTLKEDLWAGGGNFGPSLETFVNGLEIANQVYMQYEVNEKGYRELKVKVVDMGAGLERWAWLSLLKENSYESVFNKELNYIYKIEGKPNKEKLKEVYKFEGRNMDEEVRRFASIYAIIDHLRTSIIAINDGALPSNVSGGYNIRVILRRVFSLIRKYNFNFDIHKLIEILIKEYSKWVNFVVEKEIIEDIIEVEREKWKKSINEGKRVIRSLIERKEELTKEKMALFYESKGITPELIEEVGRELKVKVEIPKDFYKYISKGKKKKKEKVKLPFEVKASTKALYYKDQRKEKFKAKILQKFKNYLILNKTYFYPTSGGAIHDTGYIEGIKVIDVIKHGNAIIHVLEKEINKKEGDIVECKVDIQRRKLIERHHSSAHLINYASRKILGNHVWQHGAYKDENKGHIDITHYKSLSKEEIRKIEEEVNNLIFKEIDTEVEILERSEAEKKYGTRIYQGGAVPGKYLRIVKIGDEIEACSGLHVSNTKEIGIVKITNVKSIQDGVIRIEYKSSLKAYQYLAKRDEILEGIRRKFNVDVNLIKEKVEKLIDEIKEEKKVKEKLEILLLKELLKKEDKVIEINAKLDFGLVMKVIKELNVKNKVIICSNFGVAVSDTFNCIKELEKYFKKVVGNEKFAKGFERIK